MLTSCLGEQDLFQSDRVESVRGQTLIPPALPAGLNEEILERPGENREKAPLPLPAWLTVDDRRAARPAGVGEQDLRKRFQSDRVESVRIQTPQLCLHG